MKRFSCLFSMLLFSLFLFGQPRRGAVRPTAKNERMEKFVRTLMAKMTLQEKIGQLNLLNPGGGVATGAVVSTGVESKIKSGSVGGLFGVIGVDKIRQAQQLVISGSRLKIPMIFGSDIIHGYKTTFPIPLALSCSWDIPMIERSAAIAAAEATADGLSWAFSPMVDIARDPRWGRVAEGAGEDPFLGAKISAAMVKGYQGADMSTKNTLMACLKHFALYGAAEAGRDYNTVDMSKLKMYEYYMPPYKAAIDAGVGSVMTSFNEIDGVPATANKWLLTNLLRKQWGFSGFVVTDYTAINEMIDHGLGNLQTVSALALNAGTDMDMVGEGFYSTLEKSLKEGKTTVAQINLACKRVLEAKYKLGLFEDPFRYCDATRATNEVQSAEKRQASREFGARSMVLLKNSGILPLKPTGTVALVGPLANDKNNMLGTWAVSGNAAGTITVLQGMKNEGGNILYAKGANITDDSLLAVKANVFGEKVSRDSLLPEALLKQAVETASRADVIVAVVGEASEMTGEAASRTDITLPASQRRLLQELAKTGKPLVIVVMSGRPLILNDEFAMADALLQAWFLGDEAGNAIADVVFGKYNPSAKLTMSFPKSVGQIPIYYNHKNTGRPQAFGQEAQKFRSNYLDMSNEPLFPFGYGLSYTTFTYGEISLDKTTLGANDKIKVTIPVTNTGNRNGEEVVQLYIHDIFASVTQPVKKLKAFRKLMIPAGKTVEVVFELSMNDLKFYNANLEWVAEPGDFKVMVGGNSRDVREANFQLK